MATSATKNGSHGDKAVFQSSAPGAQELQEQLAALRGDVEALTETLRAMAGHTVETARAQATDTADAALSEVQRQARQVADTASGYRQEAEAAVKAHPAAALALASGAGFLAGLLLARR